MNRMYVRRKTNTAVAQEEEQRPQGVRRFLKRTPSKRGGVRSSFSEDSTGGKSDASREKAGKGSLSDLHSELKVLSSSEVDAVSTSSPTHSQQQQQQQAQQQPNGVKRLLKGKKLVRVKRVPGRNASNETMESVETTTPDGRKVLRVKVKRKKKEETVGSGDVDSMAPGAAAQRGRRGRSSSRRPHKSDASVGTGIVSRAKSWFTFGGMKVGSGGKDFLGVEDEDDDDDMDDELDFRTEYGDEYTTDMRTAQPDDVTAKDEGNTTVVHDKDTPPSPSKGAATTTIAQQQQQRQQQQQKQSHPATASTAPNTTATTSTGTPRPAPKVRPTGPKSPVTNGTPRSRSNSRSRKQQIAPVEDIIPKPGWPRKPPLTGVALRRLQIQEEWLAKGCNYQPNDVLRSSLAAAAAANDDDDTDGAQDTATDVSEISHDDPILLVMGPDAPGDREVAFWTQTVRRCQTTYGPSHGRMAESLLNQGVAALNDRQTGDAIECFLQAVNILQDKYGEASLAAARGLHLLGSAFFLEGQLSMAVEATRKSLDVRQSLLGPFHTDTVDTFSNLAMVYLKMGKLIEATRIFSEVVRIRKAIYHEWHPSVAFPARSLGAVYAKRKDRDRARQSYAHALTCFETHGMLSERMDTEAEMRRFGLHPPVEDQGRTEI